MLAVKIFHHLVLTSRTWHSFKQIQWLSQNRTETQFNERITVHDHDDDDDDDDDNYDKGYTTITTTATTTDNNDNNYDSDK